MQKQLSVLYKTEQNANCSFAVAPSEAAVFVLLQLFS